MVKIIKDRLELLDTINLKGKMCAEVGVFKGEFAEEIFKREPIGLLLIDPWKSFDVREYHDINNHPQDKFDKIHESILEKFGKFGTVEIIRKTSYDAFRSLQLPPTLDFVYLDGNHGLTNVLTDLMLWSMATKSGGYICGHDYKSQFVGVQMAVEEFCKITGNEVEFETADAPWKSFGIKIK